MILDRTPFYAESGGQVGDSGVLGERRGASSRSPTRRSVGSAYAHIGRLTRGEIKVGRHARGARRRRRGAAPSCSNHSATHLLHAALRKVLGTHVTQKGSLVAPDRLRFDFSHFAAADARASCSEIERLVNAEIRAQRAGGDAS